MTKLKNSNCDKTQNSCNGDSSDSSNSDSSYSSDSSDQTTFFTKQICKQKKNLKKLQTNRNVTILKYSNCDKTKKLKL